MLPAIFGLPGLALRGDERAFFRAADPAGFILFARNCRDREQLRALTGEFRALSGRDDLPILIDQEGGRVARMRPPEWPLFPPAEAFDRLYRIAPISAIEAARVNALAIALTLAEVGINVDCLPLLDLRHPGGHDIVGDRALGAEPMQVAALGRAVLDGLREGAVAGVLKHMPGHGLARADSHEELPVVRASRDELEADFAPFRALRHAPIAMTAHILYPALDPDLPASLSPRVVGGTIRGDIGFDGLLVSDDLVMAALSGSVGSRAAAAVAAGCDLALHCSGALAEMEEVAAALGPIGDAALARLDRATAGLAARPDPARYAELAEKRDRLLAYAASAPG